MNRLIAMLREQPALVTDAARLDQVNFEWLLEAFGDELMDNEELVHLRSATPVEAPTRGDLSSGIPSALSLTDGYLQAITAEKWSALLESSEEEAQPVGDWWTVMVPGDSSLGLLLLDDASDDGLISLLGGPPEAAMPICWDSAARTLNVVPIDHCGLVTRGGCAPGACGGCRITRFVIRDDYGAACKCDHQRD